MREKNDYLNFALDLKRIALCLLEGNLRQAKIFADHAQALAPLPNEFTRGRLNWNRLYAQLGKVENHLLADKFLTLFSIIFLRKI
jgi:hypothetical protein